MSEKLSISMLVLIGVGVGNIPGAHMTGLIIDNLSEKAALWCFLVVATASSLLLFCFV